jgi:RNA polymerase sigma-70 factor (ECF subfamily)
MRDRLRRGDASAFAELIDRYHAPLLRLALVYVPSRAVAEEVVQEAWLGVIRAIGRFEGRSSLKTWLFRILMNRAMRHGQRENRSIPFAALFDPTRDAGEAAVDPDRFLPVGVEYAGHWMSLPRRFDVLPEDRLLAKETLRVVEQAIASLPPAQREVITLRDLEGWSAAEVCELLTITDANQRVLLHRARSRVRHALEAQLGGETAA